MGVSLVAGLAVAVFRDPDTGTSPEAFLGPEVVASTEAAPSDTPVATPTPTATEPVPPRPHIAKGGISIADFGARCDGQSDDTAALELGIAAAQSSGATLRIPEGTCLIEGSAIRLRDVVIQGRGENSVLHFTGQHSIMMVDGPNVTFSRLRLVHSGSNDMVMFMLSETTASGLIFHRVTLDGRVAEKPGYALGIWLAADGQYGNIQILDSTLTGFTYALGINSDFRGVLDGVTVDRSTFHDNVSDDIEINTPAGTSRNVTITNSTFRDNRSSSEYGGFAIGLANVSGGVVVRNNTFAGYPMRPIHIEDRSFDITIEGNHLSRGSTGLLENHSTYIFIINGVHDVRIVDNTIDASANTNPTFCVYSGDGGGEHGTPYNISGSGNTFIACRGYNGQATWGGMSLSGTTFQ